MHQCSAAEATAVQKLNQSAYTTVVSTAMLELFDAFFSSE